MQQKGNKMAKPDIRVLEQEVSNVIRASSIDDKINLDRLPAMPDYVTSQEDTPRAGVLSAAALANQFEEAAKEFEAMGQEMKRAGKDCEELTQQITDAIEECKNTAASFREQAKMIFEKIQRTSKLADDVKNACSAMKLKIKDES